MGKYYSKYAQPLHWKIKPNRWFVSDSKLSQENSANHFSKHSGFTKSIAEVQSYYWNQHVTAGHCGPPLPDWGCHCGISGGLLWWDKPQHTVGGGRGRAELEHPHIQPVNCASVNYVSLINKLLHSWFDLNNTNKNFFFLKHLSKLSLCQLLVPILRHTDPEKIRRDKKEQTLLLCSTTQEETMLMKEQALY